MKFLISNSLLLIFFLLSTIKVLAQDKVLFLGDSCFVFEEGMFDKIDGQWIEFDHRKDRMLELIADSTVQIIDPEINNFFYNEFENCIKKYLIKNGEFDGVYEVYYPDATLQERGQYSGGNKVGAWQCFNKKGEITAVRKYDNHFKNIELIEFYEGTKSRYRHLVFFDIGNGQETLEIIFNEDNNSIEVSSKVIVRGKDKWTSKTDYYDFGGKLIIDEIDHLEDQIGFTWTERYQELKYPDDQLEERKIIWSSGNRRSIERWYANGNIEYRGIEIRNKGQYYRDGEWKEFWENGEKSVEMHYHEGAKQGIWTYYDQSGYLDKYETYSNRGKLRRVTKILLPIRDNVERFTEVYYDTNGNYKGRFEMN